MTDEHAVRLAEEGLEELQAAFALFDTDGDGELDARELREALSRLGQRLSNSEAQRLIASVSRSHRVNFDAFVRLVEPAPEGLDPEADLREAFDILDADADGYLSPEELGHALARDGDSDAAEVGVILRAADRDGDGRISFEEFRELVR